jgi:hypothetical protein
MKVTEDGNTARELAKTEGLFVDDLALFYKLLAI